MKTILHEAIEAALWVKTVSAKVESGIDGAFIEEWLHASRIGFVHVHDKEETIRNRPVVQR